MSDHKEQQIPLDFVSEEWTVEKTPLVVYENEYYAMQERITVTAVNAINELQGNLKRWQEQNFEDSTTGPEWMALGACEELGELAHILVKSKQKIRQHQSGLDEGALNEVADSVADITIYLMQLCSHLGISFGDELFKTANHVMQRDWKKYPKNGVTE